MRRTITARQWNALTEQEQAVVHRWWTATFHEALTVPAGQAAQIDVVALIELIDTYSLEGWFELRNSRNATWIVAHKYEDFDEDEGAPELVDALWRAVGVIVRDYARGWREDDAWGSQWTAAAIEAAERDDSD